MCILVQASLQIVCHSIFINTYKRPNLPSFLCSVASLVWFGLVFGVWSLVLHAGNRNERHSGRAIRFIFLGRDEAFSSNSKWICIVFVCCLVLFFYLSACQRMAIWLVNCQRLLDFSLSRIGLFGRIDTIECFAQQPHRVLQYRNKRRLYGAVTDHSDASTSSEQNPTCSVSNYDILFFLQQLKYMRTRSIVNFFSRSVPFAFHRPMACVYVCVCSAVLQRLSSSIGAQTFVHGLLWLFSPDMLCLDRCCLPRTYQMTIAQQNCEDVKHSFCSQLDPSGKRAVSRQVRRIK